MAKRANIPSFVLDVRYLQFAVGGSTFLGGSLTAKVLKVTHRSPPYCKTWGTLWREETKTKSQQTKKRSKLRLGKERGTSGARGARYKHISWIHRGNEKQCFNKSFYKLFKLSSSNNYNKRKILQVVCLFFNED